MNEELKSQVSAFVDGELPTGEADLLARRLAEDAGLRQQAAAYLEIGRLLRGERSLSGASELRARIATAIEDEAVITTLPEQAAAGRWLRPLTGVAIAASVAMLAIVGLRQLDVPAVDDTVTAGATATAGDIAGYTEPLAIDVMADRPSEMLMQYYLSHGETSGELGANGILSRLVTLELRGGELVEVRPAGQSDAAPVSSGESESTETTQE